MSFFLQGSNDLVESLKVSSAEKQQIDASADQISTSLSTHRYIFYPHATQERGRSESNTATTQDDKNRHRHAGVWSDGEQVQVGRRAQLLTVSQQWGERIWFNCALKKTNNLLFTLMQCANVAFLLIWQHETVEFDEENISSPGLRTDTITLLMKIEQLQTQLKYERRCRILAERELRELKGGWKKKWLVY